MNTSETDHADLKHRFTYHPPKPDQVDKYTAIRRAAHDMAVMILDYCPASRERYLAFTKLEEAVMWANASIARSPDAGT